MIECFALSLLYLVAFCAMGAAAYFCGALIWPARRMAPADSPYDGPYHILIRYGLGLGLLSACMVWLGLAGGIGRPAVGAGTLMLAIAVAVVCARRGEMRAVSRRALVARLRQSWNGLSRAEKIAASAAAAIGMILAANILIGGMSPDLVQDAALLYHLTVPDQWTITGRVEAFPWVFPSNYSLALEAIYAGLLLFGNETLCSVLSSQITLALLAAITVAAARQAGGRAALLTAATVGLGVASQFGLAPISVKNDRFAALSLLLGFTLVMDALGRYGDGQSQSADGASPRQDGFLGALAGNPLSIAASGFLLGTAVAAKPLTVGFCAPLGLIATFGVWRFSLRARLGRAGAFKRALCFAALLSAGGAAALAPWAVRGLRYSGDPFFPLGAACFPVRAEYMPSYHALRRANPVYTFTLHDARDALTVSLPRKIHSAMLSTDIVAGLFAVAAIYALFAKSLLLRMQGLILISFAPVLVVINGGEEVLRYFSICYPACAGAAGALFDFATRRLSAMRRAALLGVLLMMCGLTYAKRQYDLANLPFIQWRYHPIVTAAQRRSCAKRARIPEYLVFEEARRFIEPDAGVLLADSLYSYNLHRRSVWCDEYVHRWFPEDIPWRRTTPEAEQEVKRLIREKDLGYVLLLDPQKNELFRRLQSTGYLAPVPIPSDSARRWLLLKVVSP